VRPVLFEADILGAHLAPAAYGTLMTLAWIALVVLGTVAAHRLGLPWRRVLTLFVVSLIVGIVGARAMHVLVALPGYVEDPASIWALDFTGFSLYGGLLAAGLTGLLLARRWRIPIWRLADAAVPGIVAGIVLMRCGCLLNGCCFGKTTDVPWGVSFPVGSQAWTHQIASGESVLGGLVGGTVLPVHPTQLYEFAAALVLAAIAWTLLRGRRPDGAAFLAFAVGFTAFRAANWFLRVRQPEGATPDWFFPAFYLFIAAAFGIALVMRLRARRRIAIQEPPPLPAISTAY
jgi:phosphatidylglycerol:prolipoprotein diacylglycerol transferase